MSRLHKGQSVRRFSDLTPEMRAAIILRAHRLRAEALVEAFTRLSQWLSAIRDRLFDTSFGLPKTR